MKSFVEADRELCKVGASRVSGDALRAMYARAIETNHSGKAVKYYDYLRAAAGDDEIRERALPLLRDRAIAWDVLIGIFPVVPS